MINFESAEFILSLNDSLQSDPEHIEGMEIYKITKTKLGYAITANYFDTDQDLSKRKNAKVVYDRVLHEKMDAQITHIDDK